MLTASTTPDRRVLAALPLLPLPNLVLLPGMVLPLNVFEPRYLQLVDHALEHGRHVGVPLQRPRQERTDQRLVAVEPVFGIGKLVHHLPLGDGRRLIRLEAIGRVRLVRELPVGPHLFRRAEVAALPEPSVADRTSLAALRLQVEQIATRWGRDGMALRSLLALPDSRIFLYTLTAFLPSLELLAGHDISSSTGRRLLLELQQRSLAADSADERLGFLAQRAGEVLGRMRGQPSSSSSSEPAAMLH